MSDQLKPIVAMLHEQGVVEPRFHRIQPLGGGTASEVSLLADDSGQGFVIKRNTPGAVAAEASFLKTYEGLPLLPQIRHADPGNRYLLYDYLPGDARYMPGQKAAMLTNLVEQLINHYVPMGGGWGWHDDPVGSYGVFLTAEVRGAKKVIGDRLTPADHALVDRLARQPEREAAGSPHLLHGDCGVHNFIFRDGKLVGVIDPTPVVGPPIYDLLYAFCSSPDDVTMAALTPALTRLHGWYQGSGPALASEVLIALYNRIETCIKHHPRDLQAYLRAFAQWKATVA